MQLHASDDEAFTHGSSTYWHAVGCHPAIACIKAGVFIAGTNTCTPKLLLH
jgi:hypothetical protein